ncbi:tetratricopeptide repeat protein [Streptomyces collinus]
MAGHHSLAGPGDASAAPSPLCRLQPPHGWSRGPRSGADPSLHPGAGDRCRCRAVGRRAPDGATRRRPGPGPRPRPPRHPPAAVTLRSRHEQADYLDDAGRHERAAELMEQVVGADRARVLGPDHPDTLDSRHRYAVLLANTGDHERAVQLAACHRWRSTLPNRLLRAAPTARPRECSPS